MVQDDSQGGGQFGGVELQSSNGSPDPVMSTESTVPAKMAVDDSPIECILSQSLRYLVKSVQTVEDYPRFFSQLASHLASICAHFPERTTWARDFLQMAVEKLKALFKEEGATVELGDPLQTFYTSLTSSEASTGSHPYLNLRREALNYRIKYRKRAHDILSAIEPHASRKRRRSSGKNDGSGSTTSSEDSKPRRHVTFAHGNVILGYADVDVDRAMCPVSVPDLAEALKMRSDRQIPAENLSIALR